MTPPRFDFVEIAALLEPVRKSIVRQIAAALAGTIQAHEPYSFTTERELHDAILLAMTGTQEAVADTLALTLYGSAPLKWPIYSEYRASDGASRLDLLVGPVAVEFKIKGSGEDLVRQVQRYLRLPEVEHVLVVTTKAAQAKYIEDAVALGVLPDTVTTVLLQGGAW